MKRNVIVIALLGLLSATLAFNSCKRSQSTERALPVSPCLDSINTELQLDNIIDGGYIKNTSCYFLKSRKDLRYLPYYVQMFNDCYLPKGKARLFKGIYGSMSHKLDTGLMKIYNHILESEHSKNSDLEIDGLKYDFEFKPGLTYSCLNKDSIDGAFLSIDSLRVRVVAHNDRDALQKLETYYTNRNEAKELAIYYKVMLNYEGNGDLAERFYYVLRPYIDEEHQYMNGIRTVLLRAALCDHNARAQQLCDSLGFSLCDYRLPRLDE